MPVVSRIREIFNLLRVHATDSVIQTRFSVEVSTMHMSIHLATIPINFVHFTVQENLDEYYSKNA